MSVRATGILSHALVDFEQIAKLPARLEVCTDLAIRLAAGYSENSLANEQTDWRLGEWDPPGKTTAEEQWAAKQGPAIYGPGNTWIVFGEHCLFVSTHAKWRAALAHPPLLEATWRMLVGIGHVIGSETAVLWHDNSALTWDWVQDRLSLSEILDNIEEAGSQPVQQLYDLLDSGEVDQPPQRHFVKSLKDAQPANG